MSPAGWSESLGAYQLAEPLARCLAGGSLDVDPLEVIAIARIRLHLRLGGRPRERHRRLDVIVVGVDLDHFAHLAEIGHVLGAEVQHGDPVPEHTGSQIHHDVGAFLGEGDGSEPLQGFDLVELYPHATGRGHDAVEVG